MTAIYRYLALRWKYLGKKGWQPSCGKALYIQRNTSYVRRNVQDNPDYLDAATRKLGGYS